MASSEHLKDIETKSKKLCTIQQIIMSWARLWHFQMLALWSQWIISIQFRYSSDSQNAQLDNTLNIYQITKWQLKHLLICSISSTYLSKIGNSPTNTRIIYTLFSIKLITFFCHFFYVDQKQYFATSVRWKLELWFRIFIYAWYSDWQLRINLFMKWLFAESWNNIYINILLSNRKER